jgi:hypothetical protein
MAQNFDGNGPYARAQIGGGPVLVGEPFPQANKATLSEKVNYSHTIEDPLGTQPQIAGVPPFKPEVRCYTNPVPDVNGPLGQVGPASPSVAGVNP